MEERVKKRKKVEILNPALVALVIPDDHLVWEGLHDRLFVKIHHESNMRPLADRFPAASSAVLFKLTYYRTGAPYQSEDRC